LEGKFGRACKIEVHLEAFFTKPPNFGVDAYIEALAGVALSILFNAK
jgi:hypothetical protein